MTNVRIAVVNNKGGVGKTFVTLALAEAAARRGARVLVVDMDPQANATRRLGARPAEGATLTRCLQMGVRQGLAAEFVVPCAWESTQLVGGDIEVLPADLDLEDRVLESGHPGAHFRLRRALYRVDESFDLTVIDCPPSIKGHLTTMAVGALDGPYDSVLVPVTPEYDAMGGARRAVQYVQMVAEDLGVPGVGVAGMVANAVRAGVTLHEYRLRELAQLVPGVPVLGEVPLRAAISRVQDSAQPLGSDPALEPVLAVFDELARRLMREHKEVLQ